MSSREMWEPRPEAWTLEPGDTGEAILTVHADRDGSEEPKVNDGDAHAVLRALTDRQRHLMLCYVMGYSRDAYERALAQVQP